MKLESLSLANYRGFDQIDLNCEADLTVIAGVNGVGKSAVLSAIVKTLSHVLPKISLSKESTIGMTPTDIKAGKDSLTVSAVFSCSKVNVHSDISRTIEIDRAEAKMLGEKRDELRFATRETKKGSKEAKAIEDKIRIIEAKLAPIEDLTTIRILPVTPNDDSDSAISEIKAANAQPIAVFYSTSRFLSRLPPVLPKTKGIQIATAYTKSLDQLEISLNDFANWYRVIAETWSQHRSSQIFQLLETAISAFLRDVKNLCLHEERPPRFSVEKNGETFYLEQLSDGERGLLALIFDLTRRLAIANPQSDNPIAEGVALVLIDEIELHLHPKWQRQVIRKLQDVFKKCQFIVTTHSPQVIGQVKAEKLRLLIYDDSGKVILTPVSQALGMDSSWVLQNIMGVPARDYETEQKLSNIFDEIDAENYQLARSLANTLRAEIGDFPDLQEAFALLDRFELLGR
jgi:predicted ATP-binding protein involved in virulence